MSHSKDWVHKKTVFMWRDGKSNNTRIGVDQREENGAGKTVFMYMCRDGKSNNTQIAVDQIEETGAGSNTQFGVDHMEQNIWKHLDENLIFEVVKRLPPKEYVSCMLVCKEWRRKLMHPNMHIKPRPCFLSLKAPVAGNNEIDLFGHGQGWCLQRSQFEVPFPAPHIPLVCHGCFKGTLFFSLREREQDLEVPIRSVNLGGQGPGWLETFHILSPLDSKWLTLTPLRVDQNVQLRKLFMPDNHLVAILSGRVAVIDIREDTCRVPDVGLDGGDLLPAVVTGGKLYGDLPPLVAGGKLYYQTNFGLMCLCLHECTWVVMNLHLPVSRTLDPMNLSLPSSGAYDWVELDGGLYVVGETDDGNYQLAIWFLDLQTRSWICLDYCPSHMLDLIFQGDRPKVVTAKGDYECIIITFTDNLSANPVPSGHNGFVYPTSCLVAYHLEEATWEDPWEYLADNPLDVENFQPLLPFIPMTWTGRPHAELFAP